jgi:hypothetical protein
MNTNVLQKNDILKTFISEDFKEFINREAADLKFPQSETECVEIDAFYKDFIIIADAIVTYNYYEDPYFDGYSAPDETGYYWESTEIKNLHICYQDDDTNILNDVERLAIEKYLLK